LFFCCESEGRDGNTEVSITIRVGKKVDDYGSRWGAVQTLIIRSERRLKRKKNERIGAETSGRKDRSIDV
jgi:hypothetical protein